MADHIPPSVVNELTGDTETPPKFEAIAAPNALPPLTLLPRLASGLTTPFPPALPPPGW